MVQFTDIYQIYRHHFGISEIKERKRHHAVSLLLESRVFRMIMCTQPNGVDTATISARKFCSRLKKLVDLIEERPFSGRYSLQKFDHCYRNHIYPAEVMGGYGAPFHGADVYTIDAILIDRAYDEENSAFPSRGPFATIDHSWMLHL